MTTMCIAGLVYAGIAAVVFVVCLILGYGTKVDFIGNGVILGVWNSLLVAIFWPILLSSLLAGWIYDKVVFYKNL